MKNFVLAMALVVLTGLASAQTYNANNFNYSLKQVGDTASGSATLFVATGSVATPNGVTFLPLKVGTPVTVGVGSTSETVTPTAVSCSTPTIQNTCNFTASFTYAHGQGTPVRSSSSGLQEAINYANSKSGGVVSIDGSYGGSDTDIVAAIPYQNVSLQDTRKAIRYWGPTQNVATALATPTTLISTTVASNLGSASGVAGTWTAGTVYACIAYVDAMGNEGPCSATYNFTAVVSQAVGFTAPAASTGAVGYVPYLSLVGGSYAFAYRVPVTSSICTLTTIETTTAACAVTNATYGQTGVGAKVAAITVNTARIAAQAGAASTTSDYVPNTAARTVYKYAPSRSGAVGVVNAQMPFTVTTAAGTTVPAVLGTVHLPAGFMNYVGRTIRICGLAKEAAQGSTATISTIQFRWDADGSNAAGVSVSLGGPTVTATLVTANADQWQFCQDLKTTVSGSGATDGSILAGTGWLTASYGSATTVAAATGPTIGAAAVASLNLASEARIQVVYLHTTGTDGAGVILQDLTVEVLN
jgi:hypothetical protein